MSFKVQRGKVYLRETASGFLVLSWYPSRREDPKWPGLIMDVTLLDGFPSDDAKQGNRAAVERWVSSQLWAQPLSND